MAKPAVDWGLIREHKSDFQHKKYQSTSPVH